MRAGPLSLALASSATLTALTDTPSARLSLSSPYFPSLTPLLASSHAPHAASRRGARKLAMVHGQAVNPLAVAVEAAVGAAVSVLGAARAEREALVRAALQLAALPLLRPLRHVLQERRVEQPPARLALRPRPLARRLPALLDGLGDDLVDELLLVLAQRRAWSNV